MDDIRTEAVNILMLTNPSAEILQKLALSTRNEPSRGVKSAIISAIVSAADDNDRQNTFFTKNAQTARNLLRPKDYGLTSSKTYFYTKTYDEDIDVAHENKFSYIRSEDHYIPKSFSFSEQEIVGSIYKDPEYFAVMTSTVDKLLEKLNDQFVKQYRGHNAHPQVLTSERDNVQGDRRSFLNAPKIAKMLGLRISSAPSAELAVMMQLWGGKRFFAFGNDTVESIPQMIKNKYREFKNSPKFEFTSMYSDEDVYVGFPTPMGMPLLYHYTRPVVVHVSGEAHVQTQPDIASGNPDFINIPQRMNLSLDFQATWATNTESKFGIVTPFNHHKYMAGVKKHIELNAAAKTQIDVDTDANELEVRIQPVKSSKQHLFVYQTIPYTTKFDLYNFQPAFEQSGTEYVHANQPAQISYQFGKQFGTQFQYQAWSENVDDDKHFFGFNQYSLYNLNKLPYLTARTGVHSNYVSLDFDPNQSSADAVKFTFAFKHKFGKANANSGSHASYSSVLESSPKYEEAIPSANNFRSRQQEFLNRVSKEIPDHEAYAMDFSAVSEQSGQPKHQFVFATSYANSDVSPVSQGLVYFGMNPHAGGSSSEGSFEVCASTKAYLPRVPDLNMYDAIKADPTSAFRANIAVGHYGSCKSGTQYNVQMKFTQSEAYRQRMQYDKMVNLCNYDVEMGKDVSYPCQNVTHSANQLDKFEINVHYDKDSAGKDNHAGHGSSLLFPARLWLSNFNSDYLYEYIPNVAAEKGVFSFTGKFNPDYDYANYSIVFRGDKFEFARVPTPFGYYMKPYFNARWIRNSRPLSTHDNVHLPSCYMSKKYAQTFDNTTYDVHFSNNDWHTLFLYTPKQINPSRYLDDRDSEVFYTNIEQNVVVLAKESNNGKFVRILLGENEIELKPKSNNQGNDHSSSGQGESGAQRSAAASVVVNGREQSISSDHSVDITSFGDVIARIYAKPNGEVVVKSHNYGLILRYFFHNVAINAAGAYKDNVRGLCGTFNGNQYTDFLSPRNCILFDSKLFAASYSFSESGSSELQEWKQKAANAPCYKDVKDYQNIVSEYEAGRFRYSKQRRSQNSKNFVNPSYDSGNNHYSSCTKFQTKYVEFPGDNTICFSNEKVPRCGSGCTATRFVDKNVSFRCMQNNEFTSNWKSEIDSGNTPNFRKYNENNANKHINVQVPESCQ